MKNTATEKERAMTQYQIMWTMTFDDGTVVPGVFTTKGGIYEALGFINGIAGFISTDSGIIEKQVLNMTAIIED